MSLQKNVEISFGASNLIYNKQKIDAITVKLEKAFKYTAEDIRILFEQYDIENNPEALETIEDDIIEREKNDAYIKKANEELVA